MKNKPLLKIEDLRVSFFTPSGEVKAVNGLSCEMDEGDVLGIVGESGSGKSVSVNALMKILPDPGRVVGGGIEFDGRDIKAMTEREMQSIRGKDIAMIFQDPMTSLNPVYSIGNQLRETIRKHTDLNGVQANERAGEMLKLVGISNPEHRLRQYPHELSGGMRQRVMIAMAMCCNPKLLIADEPTTALDVTIQAQILDLMKSLSCGTRTSIIMITHDLGVISEICDNVIVMYGGRVVERGTVDDIFYRTSHPYTKGLLRCLPRLDDEDQAMLSPIEGTPVDLIDLPPGCSFAARCKSCMRICLRQAPPEFVLDETDIHTSACWLHTVPEGGEANG